MSEIIIKTPPHIESYKHWFTDYEVCKYNSHGKLSNKIPGPIDPNNSLLWAVYYEYAGSKCTHIGNISLMDIDWVNRKAEFSCIFGEKEYWGEGFATKAAERIFDHGFNKLNLHRIWLGTPSPNIAMIQIAKKLGMVHEGTLWEDMFLDGEYVNVERYGIHKYQWRNK